MLPFIFFVWNLVHQVHHKSLKNPENPSPPSPLPPLKKRKRPQIWLCPKSQGDAMGNPLTSVKRRGILDLECGRLGEIMSSKNCPPKNIRVFGLFGGDRVLSLMFFFFLTYFLRFVACVRRGWRNQAQVWSLNWGKIPQAIIFRGQICYVTHNKDEY